MRINRNIVECKFSGKYIPNTGILELIETLWNVNKNKKIYVPLQT